MFKILVTTYHYSSNGASVHTLVVEFTTAEEAKIAASIINGTSSNVNQTAKILFKD